MAKNQTDRKVKREANERKRRAAKPNRGGESGDRSGYRGQIRERKIAEGNQSRKGCFPKLLMLLLPFMAIGAYVLLQS